MLTRRDLIHSQQFLRQRLIAALVAHRPDPLDWSGRRMAGASFFAVMLAVIAFAVVGIYALIVPGGNTRWQACDAPIVEKETGATFICDPARGRVLYPMANWASGRLFHPDHRERFLVSAVSLDWPRSVLLGIADAPQSLPDPEHLLTTPWTVCTRRSPSGTPATVLVVGQAPQRAAGDDADSGTAIPHGEALLVAAPAGDRHLIWQGRRHRIVDDVVLRALHSGVAAAEPVGLAWLDTVPAGPDLTKVEIADAGTPVGWRDDIRLGQVVGVADPAGAERLYVAASRDSLRPVTDLQASVVIAGYPAVNEGPRLRLADHDVINHGGPPLATLLPDAVTPRLRSTPAGTATCVAVGDSTDSRDIRTGVRMGPVEARASTTAVTSLADAIIVPAGRGVLVEAQPAPQATGTLILVTDRGIGYRIPDAESRERLGYAAAPVLRLPTTVLARVPLGPDLSYLEAGTLLLAGPPD